MKSTYQILILVTIVSFGFYLFINKNAAIFSTSSSSQLAAISGEKSGSLSSHFASEIQRVVGSSNADSAIYKNTDNTLKGAFVRNTNSWTYNLDFSGVMTWQSFWSDGRRAGTLLHSLQLAGNYSDSAVADLRSGDSGHPLFAIFRGELVLLGTHSNTNAADFTSKYKNEIDNAISSMGGNDRLLVKDISSYVSPNHGPVLGSSSTLLVDIYDDLPMGGIVGSLAAQDIDQGDILNYVIASGNDDGVFELRKTASGVDVIVKNPLKLVGATIPISKQIIIRVTDSGSPSLFSDATMTIRISRSSAVAVIQANATPVTFDKPFSVGFITKSGYIGKRYAVWVKNNTTATPVSYNLNTDIVSTKINTIESKIIDVTIPKNSGLPNTGNFFVIISPEGKEYSSPTTFSIATNSITPTGNTVVSVANAGADKNITLSASTATSLTLSGSANPSKTTLQYLWTKVSGPTEYTAMGSNTPYATFYFGSAGTYDFKFTVIDGTNSSSDNVIVTVNPVPTQTSSSTPTPTPTPSSTPVYVPVNRAPVARASVNQSTVTLPAGVVLSGSASSDPDGNNLSYSWTKISGASTYNISNVNSVNSNITFGSSGSYTFRLTVSDGLTSSYDDVTITVLSAVVVNKAPVAKAGNDFNFYTAAVTSLSGSLSTDPENNSLSYSWSKISGPSTFTLSSNTVSNPNISFSGSGTYTFRLTVSDGTLLSSDDVVVTVTTNPGSENNYSNQDSDSDGILNLSDYCPSTPTTLKTSTNATGCIKPLVSNFDIKPNLEGDLRAVSNLELGKKNVGKITFSGTTVFQRDSAVLDVNSNLTFSQNKVTLDAVDLPELNKSATITLYNIDEVEPKILRNGVECTSPQCVIKSYSNGILVFEVKNFSTYEVVEGQVNTPVVNNTVTSQNQNNTGGGGGSRTRSGNTTTTTPPVPASASSESRTTASEIFALLELLDIPLTDAKRALILQAFPNSTSTTPIVLTTPRSLSTLPGPTACTTLTYEMWLGHTDVTTGGDVSRLQKFLIAKGYLSSTSPLGYYGALTTTAVTKFQLEKGIVSGGTLSTTGIGGVGVRTMKVIQTSSCY